MSRLKLRHGDITKLNVDCIVNAANNSLLGGGGVDGAIHQAAGPDLLRECEKLKHCPTGQSVITQGYLLPAKFVIHTPGPIWRGGDSREEELLVNCYTSSFMLAVKHEIKSIAYPSISTGVYRFPIDKAALIACKTLYDLSLKHTSIDEVILVSFNYEAHSALKNAMKELSI